MPNSPLPRIAVRRVSTRRCEVEGCESLAAIRSPYCRRCGEVIDGTPLQSVSNAWTFVGCIMLGGIGWIIVNAVVNFIKASF